eukprot:3263375-Amphidinium_carterae.1
MLSTATCLTHISHRKDGFAGTLGARMGGGISNIIYGIRGVGNAGGTLDALNVVVMCTMASSETRIT